MTNNRCANKDCRAFLWKAFRGDDGRLYCARCYFKMQDEQREAYSAALRLVLPQDQEEEKDV